MNKIKAYLFGIEKVYSVKGWAYSELTTTRRYGEIEELRNTVENLTNAVAVLLDWAVSNGMDVDTLGLAATDHPNLSAEGFELFKD